MDEEATGELATGWQWPDLTGGYDGEEAGHADKKCDQTSSCRHVAGLIRTLEAMQLELRCGECKLAREFTA